MESVHNLYYFIKLNNIIIKTKYTALESMMNN